MTRERVFDARRHLGVHLAVDDVVAFKFAQVLGEHFFRRVGNQFLELIESPRAALQMKQDQGFPFSTDNFSGELHGAVGVFHKNTPWEPSGYKVPTT